MPLAELRLRCRQAAAYRIPSALGRLPALSVFEARVSVTCCGSLYLMLLSGSAPSPSSQGTELTWQGLPLRRALPPPGWHPTFVTAAPAGVFTLLQHLNSHAYSPLSEDPFTIDFPEEAMGGIPRPADPGTQAGEAVCWVRATPPCAAACLLSPFLRVSFCWLAAPSSVLSPLAGISSHSYFPVQFLKLSFKAITLQVPPHSLSCHTCPLPLLREGGRWAWTPLCPS